MHFLEQNDSQGIATLEGILALQLQLPHSMLVILPVQNTLLLLATYWSLYYIVIDDCSYTQASRVFQVI